MYVIGVIMFIFSVAEPRYMFTEYLKYTDLEYTPELFVSFLCGSLYRICGLPVEPLQQVNNSKLDLIVRNIPLLDVYVTKCLPMHALGMLTISGHVGDYYIVKVVGNSGVLYHVSESSAVHNTI